MNSLAYAILGILSRKQMSGYDLRKELELQWAANLSQIYPLLSKLVKEGIVEFELIEQIAKPNKKIYSITEKGTITLKKWIKEKPTETVIRDEFIVKFYSIWLSEPELAIQTLKDRKDSYKKRYEYFHKSLTDLKEKLPIDPMKMDHLYLSEYLLIKRKTKILQFELDWCDETISLLSEHSKVK